MLSVIIPVYNSAAYLRQCVDSIISQSCPDWEVIIVDDGSSDASPSICDEYAARDARIHVIHQVNQGVSAARNAGIEAATGEYISFIDSDDYVVPDYCDIVLRSMSPDFELLFFGNLVLRSHEATCQVFSPFPAQGFGHHDVLQAVLDLKTDIRYEFFGFTWNKCFRRSIVTDNGIRFQPGLAFREDDLFTSNYVQYVNAIRIIEDNLYVYRESSSGLTVSGCKSDAIFGFVSYLIPLAGCFNLPSLQDFEFARMADLLLMSAKLDRVRALEAFAMLRSIVSARPHTRFSWQVTMIFRGFLPPRFLFMAFLWMWDVKQSLTNVKF